MDLKRAVIDLMPAPLVRTFAAPYIAGKGVSSGVAKADDLHARLGLHSTVDLLGEEVFRREDVEATVQVYFRMIEALKDRPYTSISLKPTQIGINQSMAYCQDNLRRITAAAAVHGRRITLDMEDRTLTDASLLMYKAVRDEFDNIGIVLQSRLFRTPDDIKALNVKPCRVRICIG
ncbi:MAG: proline dehydrogenase family protein, partial [Vicinamibacteria bacterium]|nr:proline dehydrogenase family protein [Vicinamibacteria bacterium]